MTKKSTKDIAGASLKRRVSRRSGICGCNLCRRSRRYYRNTVNLPRAEREWMRAFYSGVLDMECEASMEKAFANSDLKSEKALSLSARALQRVAQLELTKS